MKKEDYKELTPLVTNRISLDLLLKYSERRIETLKTFLEMEKDINRILEIQGAIMELKRFKTLREEVKEGSK